MRETRNVYEPFRRKSEEKAKFRRPRLNKTRVLNWKPRLNRGCRRFLALRTWVQLLLTSCNIRSEEVSQSPFSFHLLVINLPLIFMHLPWPPRL
jgi:hypothetical protein